MPLPATTTVDVPVNANVKKFRTAQTGIPTAAEGFVPDAVKPYITVTEQGFGQFRQTKLVLTNLPLTITDALAYLGTQIWQFPKGNISILGGTYYLNETTTSAIASTINQTSSFSVAVGTATASNISLTSTMVDLIAAASLATSATINVAAASAGSRLATMVTFDGTSTAKAAYLNVAFPTNTDIDADGTCLINGHITLTWAFTGAYTLP